MSSGAMQSNVGNPQVYNDGDQRTYLREEREAMWEHEHYMAGRPHSHQLFDSKDERSISNRLSAEQKAKKEEALQDKEELKNDPRGPALTHGNEPSRGAEIDAELKEEDEQQLKKKGKI